MTKTSITLY